MIGLGIVSKFVWRVLIVGLGLVLLLVGLGWTSSRKGENDMGVMEMELVKEVSIPAIDASVPAETEMATFALG